MKIKTILSVLTLTVLSVSTFAQKGELNSAKSNYEKYVQLKDAGSAALGLTSLTSAKTSIDKAVANEKTMNEQEAWTFKAMIYADLALNEAEEAKAELMVNDAAAALKKAVELDQAGAGKANRERASNLFAQFELNKGVKAYQTQKFEDAYQAFNKSLSYKPGDTTLTYYTGLSAINAQNYKAAIKNYAELLKTNYSANNQIALDLSKLYALEKDTVNALEVASTFAAKFHDAALATQEIELSLMSGKEKQIVTKIYEQIAQDPKNKTNYFYAGIAYSALKDPKKAEEAYKKALEIDAKYEDAAINLASTVLNVGIDLINTANKLPANKQKEYDLAIKQANLEVDRALPYLQKVVEINPKSVSGWDNLKTYYIIKRNQAKIDEITKTIQSIQ
jgi:tetratricopeptide (TPR) repeat protein